MKKLVLLLAVFLSCLGMSAQSTDDLVDLGLSVKWSSVNLGAASPEAVGNYYQWGVTAVPSLYWSWSYENRTMPDFEGSDMDAATVNLGKGWSTPTIAQWKELIDACDFEAIEFNGASGVKVTSRINGNYIFLPAGGYKEMVSVKSPEGIYYTTTHKCDLTAVSVFSYSDGVAKTSSSLYGGNGVPVRPVYATPDLSEIDLTMQAAGKMTVAIGQTGGDFDFSAFKMTFELPAGFSIESAKIAGARSSAEPEIAISEDSDGKKLLTVTNPDNVPFVRKDSEGKEVDELLTVSFACPEGTPNGDYTVSLVEIEFYSGDQQITAVIAEGNLPLSATVKWVGAVSFDDALIDLGVSVLWSGLNIGAESETETGDYYQWGTTEIPETYNRSVWPYDMFGSSMDCEGSDKDVATVTLGEGWSTPTVDQWNELIRNCSFQETNVDGVSGIMVTSYVNGNKMFLPAAGYMSGNDIASKSTPYYMTSHYNRSNSVSVFKYSYRRASIDTYFQGYQGVPVRPVRVRPQEPEIGPLVVDFCVSDSMAAGEGLNGHLSVSCNAGNRPIHKIELSIIFPGTFFSDNLTVNPDLSEAEINCDVTNTGTTYKYTLSTADGSDFIFADGDAMTTLLTLDFGCTKHSSSGNYTMTLSDIQFYVDKDEEPEKPETELPVKRVVVVSNNAVFDIETEQEVDLGLSVNWSGYYIGAEQPGQVGDYLTWGYIDLPESEYGYNPSQYVAPSTDDWCGMPQFDAATARWGDDWCTPTYEQVAELMENCESVPYVYNGQAGYALTSKINGKTIFFAASGFKQSSGQTTTVYNGSQAVVMLADRYGTGKMHYSMYLANGKSSVGYSTMNMGRGMMVRPVKLRHEAQPLVVEIDAVGAIDSEKEAFAGLVISQGGGDIAFNRVVVELTCDPLLDVTGAEVAAGRSESDNAQTTISHTEGGISVELKTADGSDFVVADSITDLAKITFSATKHVAAGLYDAEIRSINFYGADGASMAVDSLFAKQIEVVSTATYTVETARSVDMGLSVKWSGVNFGAETPGDYGTLFAPDAQLPEIDWGNGWKIPTENQAEELIANCETMPYTYEGTVGYVIVSMKNGNVIFCPANADGEARMLLDGGRVMCVRNGASAPVIEEAAAGELLPLRPVFSEIVSIREINSEYAPSTIYDLQGRRLAAPVRGLQIINNQKIYRK